MVNSTRLQPIVYPRNFLAASDNCFMTKSSSAVTKLFFVPILNNESSCSRVSVRRIVVRLAWRVVSAGSRSPAAHIM